MSVPKVDLWPVLRISQQWGKAKFWLCYILLLRYSPLQVYPAKSHKATGLPRSLKKLTKKLGDTQFAFHCNTTLQVFPLSLDKLLALSDRVQKFSIEINGTRICHGCDKQAASLNICAKCSLFWYCNRVSGYLNLFCSTKMLTLLQ
jgi:hypothetical protein